MIHLEDVKADLRVRHDSDDALILRLMQAAEQEVLRFMNRTSLPAWEWSEAQSGDEDVIAPDVEAAMYLLIQAGYDRMKPEEVKLRRERAEQLCMPYRLELGV